MPKSGIRLEISHFVLCPVVPSTLEERHLLKQTLAAVLKFARGTGEIHSLSTADMRLLALTHGLHTARCGRHSLRSEPPPPRAIKRGKQGAKQLPGWGAAGKEWEVLDNMEEAELRAYEKAQGGFFSLSQLHCPVGCSAFTSRHAIRLDTKSSIAKNRGMCHR